MKAFQSDSDAFPNLVTPLSPTDFNLNHNHNQAKSLMPNNSQSHNGFSAIYSSHCSENDTQIHKPNQDYLCTQSYSNSVRVAYGFAYLSQDNEVESTCGFSWETRCMFRRTPFTQLVRAQLSRILVVRDQSGQLSQFSVRRFFLKIFICNIIR